MRSPQILNVILSIDSWKRGKFSLEVYEILTNLQLPDSPSSPLGNSARDIRVISKWAPEKFSTKYLGPTEAELTRGLLFVASVQRCELLMQEF